MRQAVRALILHPTENQVLMGKRSIHDTSSPGQWALFGGTIDDGESPETAISRELLEEVGLIFVPRRVEYDDSNQSWRTRFYSGCTTGVIDVDPVEHSEARYFGTADIHNLDIAFDHRSVLLGFLAMNCYRIG